MQSTFDYIRDKLEIYRSQTKSDQGNGYNSLDMVPDQFIFYYGPFMCMESGFEGEVDELSKISDIMKLMQYAAFILRGISTKTYGDSKKFIRDFIGQVEVDKPFTDQSWIEALQNLGKNLLNKVREIQKEDKSFESAMINYAPIVTYSQEISKQYNADESPLDDDDFKLIAEESMREFKTSPERLKALLISSLKEIMCSYKLAEASVDPVHILDGYVISEDEAPLEARLYYAEALEYLHGVSEIHHKKYYEMMKHLTNFKDNQSYEAFESMMSSLIGIGKELYKDKEDIFDKVLEVWEDPSLTDHENEVVNDMVVKDSDNESLTDINRGIISVFSNFTALRRYIRFDEFARRKFTECLKNATIVNVFKLSAGGYIFEISTGKFILPFLDSRNFEYYAGIYNKETGAVIVSKMDGEIN